MSRTFTMKVDYSSGSMSMYNLYDPEPPMGIDNNGNPVYVDAFNQMQGFICTGYNRNSVKSFNPYTYDSYNMRWYNSITIDNVTTFNNYIFNKIHNKDLDTELSEHSHRSLFQTYVSLFGVNHPTNSMNRYMNLEERDDSWKNNACELHLIGTPEDIEELSLFPGLIIREASDETYLFITRDCLSNSILHTPDQLIEYKLDSFYSKVPNWWSNFRSEEPTIGLYDKPYSERPDFIDPEHLETINPYYRQQINPDERVYKIYIQMSDELVMTAYKRSNFFIRIRNSKEKMSIKNFMKYLS